MALRPEEIDHINTVNWFHHEFPELADDFHHFSNEHYLIPDAKGAYWQAGRKRTRMGVKKGVLDFHLALPLDGHHGLWLELKVGKNKPTPEQIAFMERKTARGYLCGCVWGHDAAKEFILTYLRNYKTIGADIEPKKLYNGKTIC